MSAKWAQLYPTGLSEEVVDSLDYFVDERLKDLMMRLRVAHAETNSQLKRSTGGTASSTSSNSGTFQVEDVQRAIAAKTEEADRIIQGSLLAQVGTSSRGT
ncbi:unnamed protein product [Amoebophrya sp. A25]|nr:unnamed protein product [Amoebophrya sp. A25]|eukprot:GSA25T00023443001.1